MGRLWLVAAVFLCGAATPVASGGDGDTVAEPAELGVDKPVAISDAASAVAARTDAIWVSTSDDQTLLAIYPASRETMATPVPALEPLRPTRYAGQALRWIRAEVGLDRGGDHWLGVVGGEFVILSWDHGTVEVRRSADGIVWSDPESAVGLPEASKLAVTLAPEIGLAPPEYRNIAGSGAGVIMLLAVGPEVEVYTSPDGSTWTRHPGDQFRGSPFGVAASDTGFAVVTDFGVDPNATDVDRGALYLGSGDGTWQRVALPANHRHLWWVSGVGDGFVAKGPGFGRPYDARDEHFYAISADGAVTLIGAPTEFRAINWDGGLLAWHAYHNPVPKLLASPDQTAWYQLPFPAEPYVGHHLFGAWWFDTLTAGSAGITGPGCHCTEYWEFMPEALLPMNSGFTVEAGDRTIMINGAWVWIDGYPWPPDDTATATWFDPATGTLTVPDPQTGETLATVTCDEMRPAARARVEAMGIATAGKLIEYPDQDLWYSPEGTSWDHRKTTDLFGDGSYALEATTNEDLVALLVAPNGRRIIGDPPGCPLDLFPEEEPYQIWIADTTFHLGTRRNGEGIGLVDPATGLWYLLDPDGPATPFYYGNPGDVPFMGDWNCDGIDTPGLYRQSDGFVYLRNSNTQGIADRRFFFGNPGDLPLAGDFNGDGCDTLSLYRPTEGRVYVINQLGSEDKGLGAAELRYYFGNPGDNPFTGDFNGDGTDTVGLHRESTGLVYFRNTHTPGIAEFEFIYGDPGDRMLAGDWTQDGNDTPALYRPTHTTFYFRYSNTQGVADDHATWGQSDWLPVAGTFETG